MKFIDARELQQNSTIEADVCIVGAGAAGITLARQFKDKRFNVCLLESGGLEIDADTQALYDGKNLGRTYFPLTAARLRYFGGTTNHWDGACRPLDETDFEARPWVAHSGWPFDRNELVPYYKRAQSVVEIGPFEYDASFWATSERPEMRLASKALLSTVFQGSPPTRFGKVYREELAGAANVRIFLNANVTEFQTNEAASTVQLVRVATLSGIHFNVVAKIFVLATGAIENARMLLLSNNTQRNGLGNDRDLVGRYFMEHAGSQAAILVPTNLNYGLYTYHKRAFDDAGRRGDMVMYATFTPSRETLESQRLMNFGVGFDTIEWRQTSPGVASVKHLQEALKAGEFPEHMLDDLKAIFEDIDEVALAGYQRLSGDGNVVLLTGAWSEQAPNPESRVTLTDETDSLGLRRCALSWQLTEQDLHNAQRAYDIVAHEIGSAGLGRVRINADLVENGRIGSFHQMGTTRMHTSPNEGVVDGQCKVHGVANLFVAGSSVFPTSGQSNPTLTIVTLALRLADHIGKAFQ